MNTPILDAAIRAGLHEWHRHTEGHMRSDETCLRDAVTVALRAALPAETIEAAVGGGYEMPDGRQFWIDTLVAHEIARRFRAAVLGEDKSA